MQPSFCAVRTTVAYRGYVLRGRGSSVALHGACARVFLRAAAARVRVRMAMRNDCRRGTGVVAQRLELRSVRGCYPPCHAQTCGEDARQASVPCRELTAYGAHRIVASRCRSVHGVGLLGSATALRRGALRRARRAFSSPVYSLRLRA